MPDDTLPERFPYGKRYYYPHMKPADIAIWERFMEQNPDAFDTCEYDVHVGDDPAFDTEVNPETKGDAWKLYQKKIDVVASKAGKLSIIELKPNAGASAVGQVKNYKRLYKRDYSPPEDVECVIITNNTTSDILEFAKEEGVKVVLV